MDFLKKSHRLLHLLNPESAHDLVKKTQSLVPLKWLACKNNIQSEKLTYAFAGRLLANPIGLAAGFDKNGEMLPLMAALGFGFLEIGSITGLPSLGNPKPRIFRLSQSQSIINRMGLPNWGAEKILASLPISRPDCPLGINIAKTPSFAASQSPWPTGVEEFLHVMELFKGVAHYFALNLSCPNTHDGKTFEDPEVFLDLAKRLESFRNSQKISQPILVKLSPDLELNSLAQILDAAMTYGINGFIVGNTTRQRNGLAHPQSTQIGGLSGKGLKVHADRQLERAYSIVGKKALLVACGGIMNFQDLLGKLQRGATLFQVYTGLVYEGPFFVSALLKKLMEHCDKRGARHYLDLVGEMD